MSSLPENPSTEQEIPFELEAMGFANNYRRALLDEFRPYLGEKVLEVGGGMGHFSELLSSDLAEGKLSIVEPDASCRVVLLQKKIKAEIVSGTVADLPSDDQFDSIVSINVLEHIEHDFTEIKAYLTRLNPSGNFCLFVPARKELFSPIDTVFGHYRRYGRIRLKSLLVEAGFDIVSIRYSNFIGYFLWWLSFKVCRRKTMSSAQVKLHDRFIFPITRWMETHIGSPLVGQSILVIARRPAE